jgi:hypothetical protein
MGFHGDWMGFQQENTGLFNGIWWNVMEY